MAKPLTGRRVLAIFVAFFSVVIAVNMVMATLASQTFSGTVVDNSYAASQEFNGWLAAARAQKALGWSARVDLDDARHVRVIGELPEGAVVTAIASHPLGRIPARTLMFNAITGGYLSREPLPAGRFLIKAKLRAKGHVADFDGDVPA